MDKVGFIGLGAMGTAMAWNVCQGGYTLAVYNRTPEKTAAFRRADVQVCETPRAVAGRSSVIIVMVTGPEALLSVLEGPEGVLSGLTAGKVVINMGTVSPETTETAARLVAAKGASFVDAPVSGSVKPAREAALVILAGGEKAVVGRVKPILLTVGKEVVECGGVGAGTRMKLVVNLMLGNMMQSLAEALMLSKDLGLAPDTLLKALAGGPLSAPIYQIKGRAILEGNYASQFPIHLMFKDLNLALEAAGKVRVPLPQTAATRECFNGAMAHGLADQDMAAVVKCLEALTGRTVRD